MPMGSVLGAGISAAGSLAGASDQADASIQGSQYQYQADQQALALQKHMFNTAKNALNPYIDAGTGAIGGLNSALNTYRSLTNPGTATATLEKLPGFKFQSEWGNLSATNALAAQGLGGSTGPLAKAISDYNSGLAQTSYGQAVSALQGYTGALQNEANMGAGAGSALAGSAANFANMEGNSIMQGGNALASGVLGQANATAGGITGATGAVGNALMLQGLKSGSGGSGGSIYGGSGGSGLFGGIFG